MKNFYTLFALCVAIALAGCQTQGRKVKQFYEESICPSYEPTNFSKAPVPCEMLRIAVLPIMLDNTPDKDLAALNTMLVSELSKTRLFEVISISPDMLSCWFGTRQLSPEDPLPSDFWTTIINQTGADGVLLTELTTYMPYTPIVIGLRMKLISTCSKECIWVFDDSFDSGLKPVAYGAQRYARSCVHTTYPFDESDTILLSPRIFFGYAAFEAFKNIQKIHTKYVRCYTNPS